MAFQVRAIEDITFVHYSENSFKKLPAGGQFQPCTCEILRLSADNLRLEAESAIVELADVL